MDIKVKLGNVHSTCWNFQLHQYRKLQAERFEQLCSTQRGDKPVALIADKPKSSKPGSGSHDDGNHRFLCPRKAAYSNHTVSSTGMCLNHTLLTFHLFINYCTLVYRVSRGMGGFLVDQWHRIAEKISSLVFNRL